MARFEDPRKTDFRARCEVAVDTAGHAVAASTTIETPPKHELNGKILGDLQSVDGDGTRFVYYLRMNPALALPQWIANFAEASHGIPGCRVYVVVTEVTSTIERSCRACGAGVLLLTDENAFELVVDPADFDPASRQKAFAAEVKRARRELDQALKLHTDQLEENFRRVEELTKGMSPKKRDEYIESIEQSLTRWKEWAEELSGRLDTAAADEHVDELKVLRRLIKQGAVDEDAG